MRLFSNVLDCTALCQFASQTCAALVQWYESRIDTLKQKLYGQQAPAQHAQLSQQEARRPSVDASTPNFMASSSMQGLSVLTSKAPEFVPKSFPAKRASQGVPSNQGPPPFAPRAGQLVGSRPPPPPPPPPRMAYLDKDPVHLPPPPPALLVASQHPSAVSRPLFTGPQVWQHQALGAVQSEAGKIIFHMQRQCQQANQGMLLHSNPLFMAPQQRGGQEQARAFQGMTGALPLQPPTSASTSRSPGTYPWHPTTPRPILVFILPVSETADSIANAPSIFYH